MGSDNAEVQGTLLDANVHFRLVDWPMLQSQLLMSTGQSRGLLCLASPFPSAFMA